MKSLLKFLAGYSLAGAVLIGVAAAADQYRHQLRWHHIGLAAVAASAVAIPAGIYFNGSGSDTLGED